MTSLEKLHKLIQEKSTIIFDSDGVLVEEGEPITGASEFIKFLHMKGKNIIVLSNNSTKHPNSMRENYQSKGLNVDRIINSSKIMVNYCKEANINRVFVVGEPGLIELLQENGISYSTNNVNAVIVGMDRDLTYEKLAIATRLIRNGAKFLGTNPDPSFPTPRGLEPGAGSMIAALEVSCDKKVDRIVGKPEIDGYLHIFDLLDVDREDCLMIGDRFETDIVGALNAGVDAIVVNTGVAATREKPGKYLNYPEIPVIENLINLIY